MPHQDAQGRWISDDGLQYWDGNACRPAGAQAPARRGISAVPAILIGCGFALVIVLVIVIGFTVALFNSSDMQLARSEDEARRAAEQIIGMDIDVFKVPLVCCETALEIEHEICLGFTVDRDARANILMLSAKGGMDIEQVAEESPQSIARLYP